MVQKACCEPFVPAFSIMELNRFRRKRRRCTMTRWRKRTFGSNKLVHLSLASKHVWCKLASAKVSCTRRNRRRIPVTPPRNMLDISIFLPHWDRRCRKRNSKHILQEGIHCLNSASNHALQMTRRHTTTTYKVAAFVSRMADAEWLRTCEAVRRFATPIGQLGEWRTLCEGGWTGAIPQDLPALDSGLQSPGGNTTLSPSRSREEEEPAKAKDDETTRREDADQVRSEGRPVAGINTANGQRDWQYPLSIVRTPSSPQHSPSNTTPSSEQSQTASGAPFEQPKRHSVSDTEKGDRSPDAHPSLESFPAPPTHLPVPLSQPSPLRQQTSRASSVSPQLGRLTESPVEDDVEPIEYPTSDRDVSAETRNQVPSEPYTSESGSGMMSRTTGYTSSEAEFGVQSAPPSGTSYRKFHERREHEGGMDQNASQAPLQPRNVEARERLHGMERTDTGESGGSIVAAMRRRYSHQVISLLAVIDCISH